MREIVSKKRNKSFESGRVAEQDRKKKQGQRLKILALNKVKIVPLAIFFLHVLYSKNLTKTSLLFCSKR